MKGFGKYKSYADACRSMNVNYQVVYDKMRTSGSSFEEALKIIKQRSETHVHEGHFLTIEDLQYIKTHYDEMSLDEISDMFDVTKGAIAYQAGKLGLCKPSSASALYIKKKAGRMTPSDMAKVLNIKESTVRQIACRFNIDLTCHKRHAKVKKTSLSVIIEESDTPISQTKKRIEANTVVSESSVNAVILKKASGEKYVAPNGCEFESRTACIAYTQSIRN